MLGNVLHRLMGRSAQVRVGRYELGDRIGMGGCGAVYAAWDPRLDRKVAIKVVLPSSLSQGNRDAEARLLREAQALAKLRHPNIVEIFDLGANDLGRDRRGRERRGVFIVMELLEGATLRQWLRGRPSLPAIIDAFAQAARGLAAAHAVGVVHRDFKPANAIITAQGAVKVLDFGLAREDFESLSSHTPTGPNATLSGNCSDSLTRTGVVMGTPRYMAPEQHGAEPITPASDQYALCVALWEALCGAAPFRASDVGELAEQKREGPPARPPTMTRALHRVLARGLEPDPAARYPGLDALVRDLVASQRAPRHWGWSAGAACAAVLAMGAVAAAPSEPQVCRRDDPMGHTSPRFERATEIARAEAGPRSSLPRRVETRLHRFADAWSQSRQEVCGASSSSAEEVAIQGACLERGASALTAALVLLEAADPSQVAGRRRLFSLPVPTRCIGGDAAALYRRDGATERELDEHAGLATAVLSAERSIDDPQTRADLDAALARVDEIGDAWVAARLLLARIQDDVRDGRSMEAARGATEAVWRAEAVDDPLLGAEIVATALAHLMDADAPYDEMRRLLDHGDDLLVAAGDPPDLRLELEVVEAMIVARRGETDEALRLVDAAIERTGQAPLPGTERMLALAMVTMAALRADRGEGPAARRMLERVLSMGLDDEPWYPYLAGFAHDVLGGIETLEGDVDGGLAESIRQQHWLVRAAGPEHPVVVYATARYGRMLVWQGADIEGVAHMEHAYRGIVDSQGSMDVKLGWIAGELARAELLRGRDEAALRWAEHALEHDRGRLGEDSPEIAGTWVTLADAQARTGDLVSAEASLRRAHARMAEDDAWTWARASSVRARIDLAREDFAAARDHAAAALARIGAPEAMPTSEGFRGEVHAQLAAALRGLGDVKQAAEVDVLAAEAFARGTYWHRDRAPRTR